LQTHIRIKVFSPFYLLGGLKVDDLFREGGVTQILSSQVPILTSATEGVSFTETPRLKRGFVRYASALPTARMGWSYTYLQGWNLSPWGPLPLVKVGQGTRNPRHEEGHP